MTEFVVITGAGSGIGKGAAEFLHAQGFQVIACVRKSRDVPSPVPAGFHYVLVDVTKPDEVLRARSEVEQLTTGAAAVHLVNNAGIAVAGPVEGLPLSRWREQFEVNFFGLLQITQAFLPVVRKTKGRVVNVGSMSGLFASPYMGAYAASKFALEGLNDSLRREMLEFGVKVVLIEPGRIATPIWQKNLEKKDETLAELRPEIRGAYEPAMLRFMGTIASTVKSAIPAQRVSDTILQALRATNPRARYLVVSRGMWWQLTLLRLLPTGLVDRLVMKGFGRR